MPHSTSPHPSTRSRSTSRPPNMKLHVDFVDDKEEATEKFPDFDTHVNGTAPQPYGLNGHANGALRPVDRWQAAKDSHTRAVRWGLDEPQSHSKGHRRQKSLSDAIRTIRTRNGSMSQNAHEIADALKAPVSAKLIVGSPRRCAHVRPLVLTCCGCRYYA